jgi:predicted nucleotidyltransferase
VLDGVLRRIEHAVPLPQMTTTELIGAVLLRHPHVKLAVVFGSLAAGAARPDSDLDLAVADDRPLSADARMALIADLAEHVGRPVDLIDLTRTGEPLLGQILAHGRRILGSDERYADLLRRHLFDEADFAPYRRRILAERRRAWIGR